MFNVIEHGIPETEMPGHWFTPREIWHVVAFVRSMGRITPRTISGDPIDGQKQYAGKGGCARCHTIGGQGGPLGPDLTDIGARRSMAYLRESLLDPESTVPDGFMQVQVVPVDGRTITGIVLVEDTFSIQIRDLSDQFRSFFRSEVKQIVKQPGRSPMPSYKGVFTPGELDNLIAYLNSLQGQP
jgi:putative heme-binding domain-containing protein